MRRRNYLKYSFQKYTTDSTFSLWYPFYSFIRAQRILAVRDTLYQGLPYSPAKATKRIRKIEFRVAPRGLHVSSGTFPLAVLPLFCFLSLDFSLLSFRGKLAPSWNFNAVSTDLTELLMSSVKSLDFGSQILRFYSLSFHLVLGFRNFKSLGNWTTSVCFRVNQNAWLIFNPILYAVHTF